MHFALIATAATAAALCAAGPLPPPGPHLSPQRIRETQAYDFPQRLREDTKMTPPLEQKPQLRSHGEDQHKYQKSGHPGLVVPPSVHPEQPGADAPKSVDRKPDAHPSNPSETQEASMRRPSEAADTLPPPYRTRKELEEYNKETPPSGKKSKHTDDEGDQMIRRCGGEPLSEK
jgi:hypothetical protein